MSIDCPYCDESMEEPDFDCDIPNKVYEYECDSCEKKFVFTFEYSRDFYAHKADCLNGAPHDYRERTCCPEYMGVGIYICRDCEHKETRWAERLEKLKAILETAHAHEHQYIHHQISDAIIKAGQEAERFSSSNPVAEVTEEKVIEHFANDLEAPKK